MYAFLLLQPRDQSSDPQALEARNLIQRKRVQMEHLKEYDEAIVTLKAKVRDLEGQDMREAMQDKVRSSIAAARRRCRWFQNKTSACCGYFRVLLILAHRLCLLFAILMQNCLRLNGFEKNSRCSFCRCVVGNIISAQSSNIAIISSRIEIAYFADARHHD